MIRLVFLIVYNIIRTAWNKIFYGKRYDVAWLQRISPSCALKLYGKGRIKMGQNTELAADCNFEALGNGSLEIGDKTYFNRFCMISAQESVKIGKECIFGPGVKIFDNNHKYSKEGGASTDISTSPIVIGNHCWIASDVIILKGSKIGNNCVIGAGCIIHGEIPDGMLVKCQQTLDVSPIK